MKKKLFYLAIVYMLLSIYIYGADNKLIISTIATDKTLYTNKTLREEYLTTLKNYKYIKHKSLFSSDIKKVSKYKNHNIGTNEAISLASNMKSDFVFIFDVVTIIADNTNTNALATGGTNNTNLTDTNNNIFAVDITPLDTTNTNENLNITNESANINITNTSPILAEENLSTNESLTNVITLMTNTSCTIYVFEPSTGEIIRTEFYDNLASTREKIDAISKSFETYLANKILDSIPKPDNDIKMNFFVERETLDNSSTILEEGEKLYNGDNITLNFDINKKGYLYIMLIQSSGTVLLIHPNDFNTNFNTKQIPIEANNYYSIPNDEDIFKISIVPTKGIDRLFLIYSERPQSWFDKDFTGTGFKVSTANTLVEKMSSIKNSLALIGKNNYKILVYKLEYYEPPIEEKVEENKKNEIEEKIKEKSGKEKYNFDDTLISEEESVSEDNKDTDNTKDDKEDNNTPKASTTEEKRDIGKSPLFSI